MHDAVNVHLESASSQTGWAKNHYIKYLMQVLWFK